MEFKDLLKHLRQENGLTQSQLADKSGVSVSAIKKYEIGLIEPKLENIDLLSRALNISGLELIKSTEKYKEFYRIFKQDET